MFRRASSESHSGFSIIELLVVITVIGILLAITAIAYPSYQERTRDSKRKNDLSTLANAYKAARVDDKNLGPYGLQIFYPNWGGDPLSGNFPDMSEPALAGNVNVPEQPGGRLGELGYLKETVMDPTWQSEPEIDLVNNLVSEYSGYTIIPCANPNMGVYAVGRLEQPSSSDIAAFNNLKNQVNEIPDGGSYSAITDPSNCFYNKDETFGFGDSLGMAFGYGIPAALAKIILNNTSSGYNYAVHIK